MPEVYVMFQKFLNVLAALICVSSVSDSAAWGVTGGRAGSARQRQNQGKLYILKKKEREKDFFVHKSHLRYMS